MEKTWLKQLTDSTSELESPERYIFWAGVISIAAVMKKNVWINRFSYKLYPNIYVLLVSLQSGLRKGYPISLAKDIVTAVGNTRVISGSNSIEGMIQTLSRQQTLEDGRILSDAQGLVVAPEISAFFVGDNKGLDILTDLHSTHEHEKSWDKTLKGGYESLKAPCINLLGGANEVMFDSLIAQKDLEGGFIGRTFIVHESERRVVNSLMEAPKNLIPVKELAEHLKKISKLKGEFTLPPIVKTQYTTWYEKIAKVAHKDKTGTLERIGDQCLRLAMILALSAGDELVISEESMYDACGKCEEFFAGTKRISMSNGKSQTALGTKLVLKYLTAAKDNKLERAHLLTKLFPDVDAKEFDAAVDTLGNINGQGILSWERIAGKMYYMMDSKFVHKFKNFFEDD